jgi:hypothetical protein
VTLLATDGGALLHHLVLDLLAKGLIVVAAVVAAALGAVLIWRKVGR